MLWSLTNFYLHRKVSIFLRNDSDCNDVDLYNTRKRYAVIDSLDLMRNISWLVNPISIVQEIKVWLPVFAFWYNFTYLSLSNILIWASSCGSAWYKRNIQNRKMQSKRVLGLMKYTHRLADHNKVDNPIRIQKVFSFWELFPATTKNWHNRTTVLYTKYEGNTKNYFLPEPKN